MKFSLTAGFAALALSACAGPRYWDHGEWLDRVSVRPDPVVRHTPQEQQALQARADRLRADGEAVRARLASETERVKRIAYLRQLEDIGDELRPVEKALQGGPLPHGAAPPP